jgi:hypothetical protein
MGRFSPLRFEEVSSLVPNGTKIKVEGTAGLFERQKL